MIENNRLGAKKVWQDGEWEIKRTDGKGQQVNKGWVAWKSREEGGKLDQAAVFGGLRSSRLKFQWLHLQMKAWLWLPELDPLWPQPSCPLRWSPLSVFLPFNLLPSPTFCHLCFYALICPTLSHLPWLFHLQFSLHVFLSVHYPAQRSCPAHPSLVFGTRWTVFHLNTSSACLLLLLLWFYSCNSMDRYRGIVMG